MTQTRRLQLSLLALRLGVAIVFLMWTIDRLTNYSHNSGMMKHYYNVDIPPIVLTAMGVVELIVVLSFLGGFKKLWSYGAILALHTVTTLVSSHRLLPPYEVHQLLYFGSLPMLGACIALFLLRKDDTLLTLDK